jgi:2-methylcitrate dehydratase PrpD
MAILLITDGKASLNDFQDDVVRRPDVQAMISRVDFYDSPAADAAGLDTMRTVIDIQLKDGRTISGQADYGKGSPQDPLASTTLWRNSRDARNMRAFRARQPRRSRRACAILMGWKMSVC